MRGAPGTEGTFGIKGVSNGPHTPGGNAVAGDMGIPGIPLAPRPIILAGNPKIEPGKVGGPTIPTGGGNDVGP